MNCTAPSSGPGSDKPEAPLRLSVHGDLPNDANFNLVLPGFRHDPGTLLPRWYFSVRRIILRRGRYQRSFPTARPGDITMRLTTLLSLAFVIAASALPAAAEDAPPPVKG